MKKSIAAKSLTAAVFLCAFALFAALTGCGDNARNAEIEGEWVPTTAYLNGVTVQYSELGIEKNQFGFTFKCDGSCTATRAGVTENGTFVLNESSIDVNFGGEPERLDYDGKNIKLNYTYNNETTSFIFTKLTAANSAQ
ncbi:MAG: hypothetical protein IIZ36_03025 [Ruminococcus sp.]|nr:hypothetical protein [Ruminococcus sp.]